MKNEVMTSELGILTREPKGLLLDVSSQETALDWNQIVAEKPEHSTPIMNTFREAAIDIDDHFFPHNGCVESFTG